MGIGHEMESENKSTHHSDGQVQKADRALGLVGLDQNRRLLHAAPV